MKTNRYRLFRRGQVYYSHDSVTKKQASLQTTSKSEAERLLTAKNEADQNPQFNLALARVYLSGHDPDLATRKWTAVMEVMSSRGKPASQTRTARAMKSKPFDFIRDKKLVETRSEDFLTVIKAGGNSTNHYLRRLHNLALGLDWLPWNVIPPKLWPKTVSNRRRALTQSEFQRIIESESNAERRNYYELLWETGASQSDAAMLTAANIDWRTETLTYQRAKLMDRSDGLESMPARIRIGPRLKEILLRLPRQGLLFPNIYRVNSNHRATEFRRRCNLLGLQGVTLHSFRYSWAERARAAGYPQRWAQTALGHTSRAVHDAYARGAEITCPPLEEYENKIIPIGVGTPIETSDDASSGRSPSSSA